MAKKEINCNQLGVKDCDFTVTGKTAGKVVRRMVEHLESEHDLDLPDPDVIMAGDLKESVLEEIDKETGLIVKRLQEKLDIIEAEEPGLKDVQGGEAAPAPKPPRA
jgi:predicted small metal-binding protein